MQISVKALTDEGLARRACEFTVHKDITSKIKMEVLARCEHSPLRTQVFWVEMVDIPSFVSTHFVRHKVGVEHFVQTNRDDRGGDSEVNRLTPVRHAMLINAQALISMARKRLCYQAHRETVSVMEEIKRGVPDWLKTYLVPECIYRGGRCPEIKTCGRYHA